MNDANKALFDRVTELTEPQGSIEAVHDAVRTAAALVGGHQRGPTAATDGAAAARELAAFAAFAREKLNHAPLPPNDRRLVRVGRAWLRQIEGTYGSAYARAMGPLRLALRQAEGLADLRGPAGVTSQRGQELAAALRALRGFMAAMQEAAGPLHPDRLRPVAVVDREKAMFLAVAAGSPADARVVRSLVHRARALVTNVPRAPASGLMSEALGFLTGSLAALDALVGQTPRRDMAEARPRLVDAINALKLDLSIVGLQSSSLPARTERSSQAAARRERAGVRGPDAAPAAGASLATMQARAWDYEALAVRSLVSAVDADTECPVTLMRLDDPKLKPVFFERGGKTFFAHYPALMQSFATFGHFDPVLVGRGELGRLSPGQVYRRAPENAAASVAEGQGARTEVQTRDAAAEPAAARPGVAGT